jgi:hypothetical protein
MYFLYRHIRLDNNKPFYIGIGTTEDSLLIKFDYSAVGRNAVKKMPVKLQHKTTGEVLEFEASKDASEFLGKGRWYVSARLKRGAIELENYKILLN